jgi:hypothetical protein
MIHSGETPFTCRICIVKFFMEEQPDCAYEDTQKWTTVKAKNL